jgi:hypothetical protein
MLNVDRPPRNEAPREVTGDVLLSTLINSPVAGTPQISPTCTRRTLSMGRRT